MSAVEVARAIREREISPVEVFEEVAKRIEDHNPTLNAYCTLDLEQAREQAEKAEQALRKNEKIGPLHGVPVAVKDDLEVKGLPCTYGSRLAARYVPKQDCLAVRRLREAGAIILGKTNLPELGHKGTTDNLLFGRTNNPWNPERTAGGSSGGSAAAVAAGMACLALGTDIGGSIRIPASCCGIVGLKPSQGHVPRLPSGNFFSCAWTAGPMAPSVADVALGLQVLAGPDVGDPFSLSISNEEGPGSGDDLRGLRVGWTTRPLGGPVEPEVEAIVHEAVRHLSTLDVRTVELDRTLTAPSDALDVWFCAENLTPLVLGGITSRWHARFLRVLGWFSSSQARLSPSLAPIIPRGFRISLPRLVQAQIELTRFVEQDVARLFADVDLLLTPTIPLAPFPHPKPSELGPSEIAGQMIQPHFGWLNTWPFNLSGQPAITLPGGWTEDKLPLGLQLVGKRCQDRLLLQVAAKLESVLLQQGIGHQALTPPLPGPSE